MTKTLYVPDHIAESKRVEKQKVVFGKRPVQSDAYVNKSEKVLNPALIDVGLKDRLPQPTGWRLLVMPYIGRSISPIQCVTAKPWRQSSPMF